MATVAAAAVLVSSAAADGKAPRRAKTEVTLAPWTNGLLGAVASDSRSCANRRQIDVFKQRGAKPDPKSDRLIGTSTARRRNRVFQWSLDRGRSGSFYAKAPKSRGCRAGRSRTYEVLPQGEPPPCPSTGPVCHFEEVHLDITDFCASFTRDQFGCRGDPVSGKWPWNTSDASFEWDTASSDFRIVKYIARAGDGRTVGTLEGTSPGPNSPDYSVDRATAEGYPGKWYSASAGEPAGQPGGPFNLRFVNGTIGADIYIYGYLYAQPN